ncbi:hypothetical protein FHG87_006910 [Trinorchestia longiramus]|nr:hypothetical protein FHG87_006910 [Trinorchestia longiramus]
MTSGERLLLLAALVFALHMRSSAEDSIEGSLFGGKKLSVSLKAVTDEVSKTKQLSTSKSREQKSIRSDTQSSNGRQKGKHKGSAESGSLFDELEEVQKMSENPRTLQLRSQLPKASNSMTKSLFDEIDVDKETTGKNTKLPVRAQLKTRVSLFKSTEKPSLFDDVEVDPVTTKAVPLPRRTETKSGSNNIRNNMARKKISSFRATKKSNNSANKPSRFDAFMSHKDERGRDGLLDNAGGFQEDEPEYLNAKIAQVPGEVWNQILNGSGAGSQGSLNEDLTALETLARSALELRAKRGSESLPDGLEDSLNKFLEQSKVAEASGDAGHNRRTDLFERSRLKDLSDILLLFQEAETENDKFELGRSDEFFSVDFLDRNSIDTIRRRRLEDLKLALELIQALESPGKESSRQKEKNESRDREYELLMARALFGNSVQSFTPPGISTITKATWHNFASINSSWTTRNLWSPTPNWTS